MNHDTCPHDLTPTARHLCRELTTLRDWGHDLGLALELQPTPSPLQPRVKMTNMYRPTAYVTMRADYMSNDLTITLRDESAELNIPRFEMATIMFWMRAIASPS